MAALKGPAPFPSLLPACTSVVGNTDIIGDILERIFKIHKAQTNLVKVIELDNLGIKNPSY